MLKTISMPCVYHVGTLKAEDKSDFSYEGDGLSVSLHPSEWSRIASLAGKVFVLENKKGLFADYYAFDSKTVDEWGLANGYIEPCTLWRYWFEDDCGQERYIDFTSLEEALEESDCLPEDIEEVQGFTPTEKMKTDLGVVTNHALYHEHLFVMMIGNKYPHIDGVWFNDDLDINALSAPRGTIFKHSLKRWSVNQTGY